MKALSFVAILALAISACGGSTTVDPIFRPDGQPAGNGTDQPKPNDPPGTKDPAPVAPIGPYTGVVGTTDVSILYPMPVKGQSTDFVRATESGPQGVLFPKTAFDAVVKGASLDRTTLDPKTGYPELALVSVRLDHCSARKGPGCTPEIRAVFQAIYEKKVADQEGDGLLGAAAADGALHVVYDVSESELVTTMKQILTLKAAQGGLASQILEVHPILAQQGLDGAFAKGLRAILLEHLGENRIARITSFDHNFEPDSDGWRFVIFDRSASGFVEKNIPTLSRGQLLGGSNASQSPLKDTFAFDFGASTAADDVRPILQSNSGLNEAILKKAFDASLRVQNPTVHTAESTDCGNCHLAEGARLRGKALYNFPETSAFTHARNLGYKTGRTSVTNLHAFGWLHRSISIMQRTANESVVVAEWMEQKVK
jgi:hypothetical protein